MRGKGIVSAVLIMVSIDNPLMVCCADGYTSAFGFKKMRD